MIYHALWAHVSWTIEDGPKATIIYSIYIGLMSLIDVLFQLVFTLKLLSFPPPSYVEIVKN
jgi:hypothetical protein